MTTIQQCTYEDYAITGWPNTDLQNHISRVIGQYSRYYKYIYVGITCRPKERLNEHCRDDRFIWERCVIKYKSDSERNVNIIEGWFIHDDRTVNKYIGWSHLPCNPCYLYILLGNKVKKVKK